MERLVVVDNLEGGDVEVVRLHDRCMFIEALVGVGCC